MVTNSFHGSLDKRYDNGTMNNCERLSVLIPKEGGEVQRGDSGAGGRVARNHAYTFPLFPGAVPVEKKII